jgi:hypothetical protein
MFKLKFYFYFQKQDTIERRVINDAASETQQEFLKVEVQYKKVKIAKYEPNSPTIQTIDFSRHANLSKYSKTNY